MNSYEKFTNNYPFPYEYPNTSGQTRAMGVIPAEKLRGKTSFSGTLEL
ncbi:MAG: hypothetical protein ACR2LR_03765 [Hassallia sp.]